MNCSRDEKFMMDDCTINIPNFPVLDYLNDPEMENEMSYDFGRKNDMNKIQEFYETDKKCAILGYPYMAIRQVKFKLI